MNVEVKQLIKEEMVKIREKVKKVYPYVKQYLEKHNPELIILYDDYYKKVMEADPVVAMEYAYRILRLYVEIMQ